MTRIQTLTQRDQLQPAQQRIFDAEARQRWSAPELVELVSVVAHYSFLAVVLDAFDVTA